MSFESKEIEKELNFIKMETIKTKLKKKAFINEIKNGLGEMIKETPNNVKKDNDLRSNKTPLFKVIIEKLKKMF